MPRQHEDLTDHEFGLWRPIELDRQPASEGKIRTRWICQCGGCGRRQSVLAQNLKSGATTSCRFCSAARRKENPTS